MIPGSTVQVEVDYTDTKGDRETVTKDVQMSTGSSGYFSNSTDTSSGTASFSGFQGRARVQQQSFWSQYKWYVILLVVIVLGVLLHSRYRKKKMLDPDFKLKDIFKK